MNLHKKEKGSSLLLVLVAVLLLITLGTVALSMSLSNIRMSVKVKDYNKDYYDLERASQVVFRNIDEKLIKAENLALNYIQKNSYKIDYEEIQHFDEIEQMINASESHKIFKRRWEAEVRDKSYLEGTEGTPNPVTDTLKYEELLEKYLKAAFNRLYFNYCQKLIKGLTLTGSTSENIKYDLNIVINKNKKFDGKELNWDKLELKNNDFVININLDNNKGKIIEGSINVVPPIYGSMNSDKYRNFRANPIWTNAITAKNGINFINTKENIYGDVVSMGEANNNVMVENSQFNIYGNLCATNDIIFKGSNKLEVKSNSFSDNTALEMKKKVYSDKWFFDDSNYNIVSYNITSPRPSQIVEGLQKTYQNSMPIIFNDMVGGNTYCNKVNISGESSNSEFITRNMLTRKGVYLASMNGKAKVNINDIFIGTTNAVDNYVYDPDNKVNELVYNLADSGRMVNKGSYGQSFVSTYIYNGNDNINSLDNILSARTKWLGTHNRNFNSFITEEYIKNNSESKIQYLSGNSVLDLTSATKKTGIIYCDGNLNIKGKGTFNGTIICNGTVTITGEAKIIYDEKTILNVLRDSEKAISFFEIGEIGKAILLKVDSDSTVNVTKVDNSKSRTRINKDRYKVTKWSKKASD